MRLELQSALCAELTEANLRGWPLTAVISMSRFPATGAGAKARPSGFGLVATLSVGRRYDLLYWDEVGPQVFSGGVCRGAPHGVPPLPAFALQETG